MASGVSSAVVTSSSTAVGGSETARGSTINVASLASVALLVVESACPVSVKVPAVVARAVTNTAAARWRGMYTVSWLASICKPGATTERSK